MVERAIDPANLNEQYGTEQRLRIRIEAHQRYSQRTDDYFEWIMNRLQPRPGDLVLDGVCSLFIADKLGVSQPTCGEHLKVLSRAGLIRGTKIKQWVFYQRDEARIAAAKELLSGDW